jgi:hypothetical protein
MRLAGSVPTSAGVIIATYHVLTDDPRGEREIT